MPDHPLPDASHFRDDGLLILRGFYDVETELRPIQRGVRHVIDLMCRRLGLPEAGPDHPDAEFDRAYAAVLAHDRAAAGLIYDGVKQLAPFLRLVASERHERLFAALRGTRTGGVVAGGSGIRIDNPAEERFRAQWHQEYPAQGRSLNGCVFWAPLVPVTQALGPLEICRASHVGGLRDVVSRPTPGREGAYALELVDEERVVGEHEIVAPLVDVGDLVVLDFLTIHRSGRNEGERARWTMQSRWFDFEAPEAVAAGWGAPRATVST